MTVTVQIKLLKSCCTSITTRSRRSKVGLAMTVVNSIVIILFWTSVTFLPSECVCNTSACAWTAELFEDFQYRSVILVHVEGGTDGILQSLLVWDVQWRRSVVKIGGGTLLYSTLLFSFVYPHLLFPSLPLEIGPLKCSLGSGSCKLLKWGRSGAEPQRNRILYILPPKSDI